MSTTENTKQFKKDLNALVNKGENKQRDLTREQNKEPIKARRGYSTAGADAGTTGIASPLTETDYADRTYHTPALEIASSDGLIIMEYKPIATMSFTDDTGRPVDFIFDEP